MATLAPSLAQARAMASPIPLEPPVTTRVLPLKGLSCPATQFLMSASLSMSCKIIQYDVNPIKSPRLGLYIYNQIQFGMGQKLIVTNLIICIVYGILSVAQTLNSRTLFKTLHFNFYSFTFATQRILIIIISLCIRRHSFDPSRLAKVIPYAAFMCVNTILSSYCLTIMPLGAFLSFKKLIVVFIMIISCTLKLPVTTSHFQNICVVGIVAGGLMVGEKDMLSGEKIGYVSCLMYDLSEAVLLQYSAYLCRNDGFEPTQLQFYNAIISLPYYLGTIFAENQAPDIINYFSTQANLYFLVSFAACVCLAVTSEFSANWIAMKISPFEKSTVSNIKDLILMVISVYYYHDLLITWLSGTGIVICLTASALFSIPFLQQQKEQLPISQTDRVQIGDYSQQEEAQLQAKLDEELDEELGEEQEESDLKARHKMQVPLEEID